MPDVSSSYVLVALIGALAPVIASIASLIVVLRTASKVEEVHKATNSMKDALVAAALVQGHAEGVEAEKLRKTQKEAIVAGAHAAGVADEKAQAAERRSVKD